MAKALSLFDILKLYRRPTVLSRLIRLVAQGPYIKYVTLEGKGSKKVWQFMTEGGGPRACDVTLLKFIHVKLKIESDVSLYVVMDVFWQKEWRTKATPDKTFQTK